MSQASFQKRMREKARAEKAALKQQRKQERAAAAAEAGDEAPGESVPQDQVLAQLETLHRQFADDQIEFEDFEERKQELMAQLNI